MITAETRKKIKDEFERTLDGALNNNPDLSQIREIKIAADWFRKTREGKVEPGKIFGFINRLIISNVSDNFVNTLSNNLEQKLGGMSLQHGHAGTSMTMFVPGVQTSVDVTLVANGSDLITITIGVLQDIGVVADGVKKSSDERGNSKIDKMVVSNNLYLFTKMILGMKKKKVAYHQFELKDIVL